MQKIGKQIRITVTEFQDQRIEMIAKKHEISKACAYRNMIDAGLDLHDDFEKVGAFKIVDFVGKVHEMSKHWTNRRQLKLF